MKTTSTSKRAPKRNSKPLLVKHAGVTVKIYSRTKIVAGEKYTVHEVCDYLTGRRRLQSFSDEREATKKAREIAGKLATGQAHAATMTNQQTASYGRAVELLAGTGVPLEIAAAHFAEGFKALGNVDRVVEACQDFATRNRTIREHITVARAVEEFAAMRKARRASERYLEDICLRLGKFATRFQVDLDTVTTADCQSFLDGLNGSPRNALNYRRLLITLFEFAVSRGFAFENPAAKTEEIRAKSDEAISIYTVAEIEALLKAAHPTFRPVIAIAAFGGLRTQEIMRLDWSEIDFAGGHIEVKAAKAKTASRRLVPLQPNLAEWLKPHAKPSGHVFRGCRAFLHERQREAATKANVEWRHNACRHSYISNRVALTNDVQKVALECGNSPSVIFSNYRELVKPADAQRWFAIRPQAPANVLPLPAAATA